MVLFETQVGNDFYFLLFLPGIDIQAIRFTSGHALFA